MVATVRSAQVLAVMRLERVEVHPVELVAREDEHAPVRERVDVLERLPDGVGGALKPVVGAGCLLGREDRDEAVTEAVEAVGPRHVPVEAGRVVLREHKHPHQLAVDTVRDRNVDQAVAAGERDGGAWSGGR